MDLPKDTPIVCSHKRSGVHLLMASLYQNYVLPDVSFTIMLRGFERYVSDTTEYTPGQRAVIPWRKLHGSHNFYNPRWTKNPKRILYIVRHPVCVLMSFWRFYDPSGEEIDRFISEERMHFWAKHAKGYTDNCFWIRYEDLIKNYEETLTKVASQFNLELKQDKITKVVKHVGFFPTEEPVQSKKPTPEIIERFKAFFPDGVLGYDMDVLDSYTK